MLGHKDLSSASTSCKSRNSPHSPVHTAAAAAGAVLPCGEAGPSQGGHHWGHTHTWGCLSATKPRGTPDPSFPEEGTNFISNHAQQYHDPWKQGNITRGTSKISQRGNYFFHFSISYSGNKIQCKTSWILWKSIKIHITLPFQKRELISGILTVYFKETVNSSFLIHQKPRGKGTFHTNVLYLGEQLLLLL